MLQKSTQHAYVLTDAVTKGCCLYRWKKGACTNKNINAPPHMEAAIRPALKKK